MGGSAHLHGLASVAHESESEAWRGALQARVASSRASFGETVYRVLPGGCANTVLTAVLTLVLGLPFDCANTDLCAKCWHDL